MRFGVTFGLDSTADHTDRAPRLLLSRGTVAVRNHLVSACPLSADDNQADRKSWYRE